MRTTHPCDAGLDLVDFDPSESDLESGRRFRSTWGFDRVTAAEHVDRLLDGLASRLEPTLAEQALGTTARILIDRLETTQRDLATTRSALAVETDIATRDPLTGLLNREGLERWLGGPESDGLPMPPMGVILIDLDGFKAVNDTRGHLVGDQLLCVIADALLETTRPGDVAARWGGDEFIVLCPDGARVSASAGIKTCSQRPLPLGDADAALSAAKAAGGAQFAMK